MWDRLATIEQRFEELTAEMGRPEVAADHERLQALARERASFEEVVTLYRQYRDADKALGEAKAMADGNDAELAALAKDEAATLSARHGI
jgi:peptide chain release factor 1